ncbi:RNA polymerase sigma factor [Asticcacaulis sp. BYS171W]|uniref:RNA polymerase sigma factor n=1 Tax=Asticcacaulis aquaticus TaxID=2984212 RepID=A0ABT5HS01_9CAUL|nr:RNA polymerase sigma factor [Asticcacaulis aquaticus]MDC7682847.1 RNA polymerase sigma factor [Asticcacaulis aquaticus]
MDSLSDPDEALIAAVARGDAAATQALVSRKLPRVLSLARRLLSDAIEAEDVAQEALLRMWKQAPHWVPGRARLDTWLHKVAVNLCYDRLRRRKDTVDANEVELVDTGANPTQRLDQQQASAQVEAALNALPERQKLAIVLCYYQELSNIEAAGLMEVSVEALESLLSRGRRQLKALLSEQRTDLLGGGPPAKDRKPELKLVTSKLSAS